MPASDRARPKHRFRSAVAGYVRSGTAARGKSSGSRSLVGLMQPDPFSGQRMCRRGRKRGPTDEHVRRAASRRSSLVLGADMARRRPRRRSPGGRNARRRGGLAPRCVGPRCMASSDGHLAARSRAAARRVACSRGRTKAAEREPREQRHRSCAPRSGQKVTLVSLLSPILWFVSGARNGGGASCRFAFGARRTFARSLCRQISPSPRDAEAPQAERLLSLREPTPFVRSHVRTSASISRSEKKRRLGFSGLGGIWRTCACSACASSSGGASDADG